ncbi:protein RD3 [Tachysurus fulvidraco]|uniref:protein RD3 n=1 Tax=Tachysurus fulvidraco TaxID=1234273 RepID=UPI001FED7DC8|nr:protein RD3 [Tachysurus fulvidraco]
MFPWSKTFSLDPQRLNQRSPEEMVTHTLMQELGSLLKRTEHFCQVRAAEIRRRNSCVDYSWLAATPQKPSYEIMPGELLELQELCLKIPPSQCGPIILRVRKLVRELEPEVTEVPQLFRLVLCDCLDEQHEDLTFRERSLRARAIFWSQHRSKSAFSIGLSSHQFLKKHWSRGSAGQNIETLCKENEAWAKDEENGMVVPLCRKVRSMPDFSSTEESKQT